MPKDSDKKPLKKNSSKNIRIFTDGSCDTTSGEGGWGYLLIYTNENKQSHQKKASGYEAGTTNNRMELTAAVRALEALKEPCFATIITDSQYLKKAFTDGWLSNWQKNGWKTAAKKPVKNKDLWLILLELAEVHALSWEWTKGHAGHVENELVDDLALTARKTRKGV